MIDSYRTGSPEYRPYINRARRLRSDAVHAGLSFVAQGTVEWLRTGFQKMKCRRTQYRLEQQLRSLSSATLKDIGMTKGEVTWRVQEALPCS